MISLRLSAATHVLRKAINPSYFILQDLTMIGFAPVAGLLTTLMHITDPAMTPQVFNHWYEDVHIQEAISLNVSNLVLRYTNYTLGQPKEDNASASYSTHYLGLWKLPNVYKWNDTEIRSRMPRESPLFPDGGKEKKPVTTWVNTLTSIWQPIQRFEGKSKQNDTAKFVIVAKIEPAKGAEDELELWYRTQVR